jgi:trans-aconitate 2-methyltransferase
VTSRAWDAETYDRVSGVQVAWAKRVLERLPLRGDETVLDAGCGSGRVTRMLLDHLPAGHVIAVDADESMVAHAREALAEFLRTVVLGVHLPWLPEELRDPFVEEVLARCEEPLRLRYARLNIDARR